MWTEVIRNGFVGIRICASPLLTTPSPGAWDSCGPESFASMFLIIKDISTEMLRKYSQENKTYGEKSIMTKVHGEEYTYLKAKMLLWVQT